MSRSSFPPVGMVGQTRKTSQVYAEYATADLLPKTPLQGATGASIKALLRIIRNFA